MPNNKKKPKPTQVEREIKTYNPTKSRVGKVIIILLAAGMFLATLIAAIMAVISVL